MSHDCHDFKAREPPLYLEWQWLTSNGHRPQHDFIPSELVGCERHIVNIVATTITKLSCIDEAEILNRYSDYDRRRGHRLASCRRPRRAPDMEQVRNLGTDIDQHGHSDAPEIKMAEPAKNDEER